MREKRKAREHGRDLGHTTLHIEFTENQSERERERKNQVSKMLIFSKQELQLELLKAIHHFIKHTIIIIAIIIILTQQKIYFLGTTKNVLEKENFEKYRLHCTQIIT